MQDRGVCAYAFSFRNGITWDPTPETLQEKYEQKKRDVAFERLEHSPEAHTNHHRCKYAGNDVSKVSFLEQYKKNRKTMN